MESFHLKNGKVVSHKEKDKIYMRGSILEKSGCCVLLAGHSVVHRPLTVRFPALQPLVRNTVYYNGKARVYTCRGCHRNCLSALLARPRHHLVSREANTGARAIRWMALVRSFVKLSTCRRYRVRRKFCPLQSRSLIIPR